MKLPLASHTALMPDKEHAVKLPEHIGCVTGDIQRECLGPGKD